MPRELILPISPLLRKKRCQKYAVPTSAPPILWRLPADADAEFFAQALTACLNDDNVDGVVITLSPTAANATPRTTQLLANAAKTSFKPVIVCWAAPFAESLMRSSFKRSGLPCLATPQLAVRAFANLARYESLKKQRLQPPSETLTAGNPDLAAARRIVRQAKTQQRFILSDNETAELLQSFGISSLTCTFAPGENEAAAAARRIGFPGSGQDFGRRHCAQDRYGGVILNLMSESEVREAFRTVRDRCAHRAPMAFFKGVFVAKNAHSDVCAKCVSAPPPIPC